MKHLILISALTLSLGAFAQDKQNISVKGSVTSIDSSATAVQQSTQKGNPVVIYTTIDNTKYYLLPSEDKPAAFKALIKHPNSPARVNGTLVKKGGKSFILVESYIFR